MPQSNDRSVTPYDELVLVDDRGDYAVLTINRPEKRNAISVDAMKRLREALAEVADKKVVVLTGTGSSFCAGVDLTAENVGRAIRKVRPWAVDVSSGVEASRGVKDPAKIVEFIRSVQREDAGQPA